MKVLLCGVRGSSPAPGAEFTEVGGNTSCVAIPAPDDRWLVLDAGTGLRRLGPVLGEAPLRGSILLTHLHWDHTQGLPFLTNADRPDAEVSLSLPAQGDGEDPIAVLKRAMSPPHFPIGPEGLLGWWRFGALAPGRHEIEGFVVTAAEVEHKGGRTYGYRVEGSDETVAYIPDHCPRLADPARGAAAIELAHGVDVLLHGGQFLVDEQAIADDYGHATVDDALAFAREAGVSRLVLVHHAPARTDHEIAELASTLDGAVPPVSIGCEGQWIDVHR
jgi:phosphoribosyl 1,2-cyclic phosphodiesterase